MRETIPMDFPDGAKVTVDIERAHDHDLVIHGLTITAPAGKSITAEHLRAISLMDAALAFRERERTTQANITDFVHELDQLDPLPTKGRWASLTEDDFAGWAEDYLRTVAANPRSPIQDLAASRGVSGSVVVDRLKACRKYDWLWGTTQGRVGAIPGPRLQEYRHRKALEGFGGVQTMSGEETAELMAGLRSVEQVRQDHAHEGVELDEQLRASADADKET